MYLKRNCERSLAFFRTGFLFFAKRKSKLLSWLKPSISSSSVLELSDLLSSFFKLTTCVPLRRVICPDFAHYSALCDWGFSLPDLGQFWGRIQPWFGKYAKINHCNFLITTLCCQWKDADIQGRNKFHRRKYVFLIFFPWGLSVLSVSFPPLYILNVWKIAKVSINFKVTPPQKK